MVCVPGTRGRGDQGFDGDRLSPGTGTSVRLLDVPPSDLRALTRLFGLKYESATFFFMLRLAQHLVWKMATAANKTAACAWTASLPPWLAMPGIWRLGLPPASTEDAGLPVAQATNDHSWTTAATPKWHASVRATFGAKNTRRSSSGLTRPKLGFELSSGEEKCQIGEAGSVGERCEFAGQFGNIGRSGMRTFDNLSDFNRFRSFFVRRNPAQAAC